MKIETMRLLLRPLSSMQLALFMQSPDQLSRQLQLNQPLKSLDEHMIKVYRLKQSRIEAEPASLLYNTYFIIILKEAGCAIGSISLKGNPDAEGLVEVGYAIDPEFRNQGYMREALEGFLEAIMQIKEVSGVNACTSIDNLPSQKVLQACGFDCIYAKTDMLVWRYASL